jgi:hypothetical protein
VNIALEGLEVRDCPSFDSNGNRKQDINELIMAVNNALDGCKTKTPTATPKTP